MKQSYITKVWYALCPSKEKKRWDTKHKKIFRQHIFYKVTKIFQIVWSFFTIFSFFIIFPCVVHCNIQNLSIKHKIILLDVNGFGLCTKILLKLVCSYSKLLYCYTNKKYFKKIHIFSQIKSFVLDYVLNTDTTHMIWLKSFLWPNFNPFFCQTTITTQTLWCREWQKLSLVYNKKWTVKNIPQSMNFRNKCLYFVLRTWYVCVCT